MISLFSTFSVVFFVTSFRKTLTMKKEFINESGPEVSAAIYGFWRWTPGDLDSPAAFRDSVLFTRELGITTYDLSPSFAFGMVEQAFGDLFRDGVLQRDEVILIDKVGQKVYSGSHGTGTHIDHSPQHIAKSVETSLERLHTDKLDILILEGYDLLADPEETASALLKLQRQGKIGHIGACGFTVSQQRLLSSYLSQPLITNHIELSLLETAPLFDGKLDFIRGQHSRAMAFSPLADGRILLGSDDKAVRTRIALSGLGRKYEANVEQMAVAWLHRLGALPIIGSKEKRRIQNAATAWQIRLTHEDWYILLNASLGQHSETLIAERESAGFL
jgi:predicted oxidoreductase